MIEEGKFDWVIQWSSLHAIPKAFEWETIPLTRKENALTGQRPMKPRSLEACVGLYNRIHWKSWIFDTMNLRIYNLTTGESIPIDALGNDRAMDR